MSGVGRAHENSPTESQRWSHQEPTPATRAGPGPESIPSKTSSGLLRDMLKVEESSGWAVPRACESCRSAPCTVYCRADAAALCAACDASIHSANLLARRHHRVPLLPDLAGGGLVVRPGLSAAYHVGVPAGAGEKDGDEEAAAWLLFDDAQGGGEEADEFLDLVEYDSSENECGSDQQQLLQEAQFSHGKSEEREHLVPNELHQQQSLQMEFDASNGFNYSSSHSHRVSC
ncbi:hypothetical protein B296_00003326 [Ensete ventricosum]|uniref:B box-type domain-containing protein n=1 Tax=Ensete ventricosum TaxID=4639 RepID=A0A427AGJ5_ENSVE|nr:hypothetical protein B296_00003326 [Ensete ventricosum]